MLSLENLPAYRNLLNYLESSQHFLQLIYSIITRHHKFDETRREKSNY